MRTSTGLVVETGSAREVHHFALLAGYGAEAVHPYLALETLAALHGAESEKAIKNYIKAIGKGLNKVMSKMGISTYMSYCGAQIFEAVGLNRELVDKYFRGTASNVGGLGLFEVMEEAVRTHRSAFSNDPVLATMLDPGGEYQWRVRGEEHMWTPDAIAKLQHSARANNYQTYKEYAQLINDQSRRQMTLRGLFEFRLDPKKAIPLDEVEPAKDIVRRFATGAMSLGSISTEAHTTLAIAMNRIGGKSNTGEGGEDPARYQQELRGVPIKSGQTLASVLGRDRVEVDIPLKDGDSLRSKIKQVASGRFGVTTEYLVSADQIQIKMAQGAKPGEGGQLPGHKVSEYIAMLRFSVPGCRTDLAPAAPRHLFDRGPCAADPRPEERQSAGVDQREARVRSRRRHGRGRRGEGQGRPRDDRRPRRRYRCLAGVVDQARRHAMGTGACRNAADTGAESAARPHRGAGRRPDEDWS